MAEATERGLYSDPDGTPRLRFWDGSRWTQHYALPPGPIDRLLMAGERRAPQDPTRLRRGCLVAVIVVLVLFGSGFAACAYVVSQLPTSLQFFGPPLKPIPVPQSSCPHLRRVHDTAETAGRAWGIVGGVPPSGTQLDNPKVWPLYVALLRTKFSEFDRAITAAVPHVPAPIGARLQEVRDQVAIGLDQLPKATTANGYASQTASAVFSGYASLSEASELTGNACGFRLAPDPSVAGWPLSGPTPTT